MTFPLYYFLIPYAILMLFGLLFVGFNVLHMMAFGLQSLKTGFFILLYVGATAWVLRVSYQLISVYDWNAQVSAQELFESLSDSLL